MSEVLKIIVTAREDTVTPAAQQQTQSAGTKARQGSSPCLRHSPAVCVLLVLCWIL